MLWCLATFGQHCTKWVQGYILWHSNTRAETLHALDNLEDGNLYSGKLALKACLRYWNFGKFVGLGPSSSPCVHCFDGSGKSNLNLSAILQYSVVSLVMSLFWIDLIKCTLQLAIIVSSYYALWKRKPFAQKFYHILALANSNFSIIIVIYQSKLVV